MAGDDELEQEVNLGDYQNLTVRVELTPAMGDLAIRNNDTLYQEYIETIANFTDVMQYNYKTNGLNVSYD